MGFSMDTARIWAPRKTETAAPRRESAREGEESVSMSVAWLGAWRKKRGG
jgi:hypothetical protein